MTREYTGSYLNLPMFRVSGDDALEGSGEMVRREYIIPLGDKPRVRVRSFVPRLPQHMIEAPPGYRVFMVDGVFHVVFVGNGGV